MFAKLWKPATALAVSFSAAFLAAPAAALAERTLFIESAVEHPDNTATLPLYRALTGDGREVWFVVLDAAEGKDAAALRVNQASKLNNARDSGAVMHATCANGSSRCGINELVFPASVDFSPERVVVPGPTGFPPAAAIPGSVGEPGYSPLVQLPNGNLINAPHVANASGRHDKVQDIDFARRKVRLHETDGVAGGKFVKYISTESSFDVAAALEGSTYVPGLNAAPFAGGDGTDSARASLGAFVNGQTGAGNPNRQGLNSALLDGLDPLNIASWTPNQGRYSPLWDIFPLAWSDGAIAQGLNLRQTDWGQVKNLAQKGLVTGPGGAPFGAGGFIVNCPIVSGD
ncbi:MAG TPA: hypothetical protein VFP70_12780 [Burkholderiales bacterium]|nr:hypothetical protein [Burkholderiales bacterium]